MKRPLIVVLLVCALLLSMVGTAGAVDHSIPNKYVGHSSAANNASFWVSWAAQNRTDDRAATGGYVKSDWVGATVTCAKITNESWAWFTLPTPPAGQQYAMVIVKTGSGSTANAVYWNPMPVAGDRVRNGNGVSHVIACYEPIPTGSLMVEKLYQDGSGDSVTAPDPRAAFKLMPGDLAMTYNAAKDRYCVDGLTLGAGYTIVETTTPSGFIPLDDSGPHTVTNDDTCAERLAATTPAADVTLTNRTTPRDVTVVKYKVDSTTPLEGFEFKIFAGHDADPGTATPIGTAQTTDASGETLFEGMEAPGDYTVCETDQPNDYWTEGGCQNVSTVVGSDPGDLTFYNEPLSDVTVDFFDETGYTRAEIVCYDSEGTEIGRADIGDLGTDNSLDLDKLGLGDYDCTVKIRNGDISDLEPVE